LEDRTSSTLNVFLRLHVFNDVPSLFGQNFAVQGYLAHKKPPNPEGPTQDPRHGPTVGSYWLAVSLE